MYIYRHLLGTSQQIEEDVKRIHGEKADQTQIEGDRKSSWMIIDYSGDIFVHIMLPEARSFYKLESLWASAARIDLGHILLTKTKGATSAGTTTTTTILPMKNEGTQADSTSTNDGDMSRDPFWS